MRFQGELVSVEMNPLSARMVRRNTAALNGVPGFRSRVVNAALVSTAEAAAAPEMRFMGKQDGLFLNNRLTSVKEHEGSEYSMLVPTVSLPALLVRSPLSPDSNDSDNQAPATRPLALSDTPHTAP